MPPRDDADEIKKRLNDRLEQLLKHFWPGFVTRGKIAYCAPGAKKDLGSFQVYLGRMGKYGRGSWVRSSAGIGGDEINLFAYGLSGNTNHHANADVFRAAKEWVGLDTSRPETPEERERRETMQADAAAKRQDDDRRAQEEQQVRVQTAGGIWMESIGIAGTLAEAYMVEGRGIPIPPGGWGDVVRFHPALPLNPDKPPSSYNPALPCKICRVDDVFGDLTAIWRIYLDPKKPAKAPIPEPKMGFGPAAGGAIRIGGVADHIGASEGYETARGASALIKYRYPVWSMMSTSGLIGFEVPMEVDWITGFPDGDKPWKKQGNDIVLAEPAGRAAMRRLGERVRAIDKRFDLQPEPRLRMDYADIWQARRRAEARA